MTLHERIARARIVARVANGASRIVDAMALAERIKRDALRASR